MFRLKSYIHFIYITQIFILLVNDNAFAQQYEDSLSVDSFQIDSTLTEEVQANTIQTDSSHIKVEKVPWDKIAAYRSNKDFDYTYKQKIGFDFWSRFLYWLDEILNAIFSKKGVAPYLRLLFVVALVAFLVYLVLKSDISGIFSKNKKAKNGNEFDYFDEDIHNQDLEEKMKQSIAEKNYRKAIRYHYLILLKNLDLSELIQWTLSKTNQDYIEELTNHPVLGSFKILSGIYEYTWYGSFTVSVEHFSAWQVDFEAAIKQINQK